MHDEQDIQFIVLSAIKKVITLKNQVSTLREVLDEKVISLNSADKSWLIDQLDYALHWYGDSNTDFRDYLYQKMPLDKEGYDMYVNDIKKGENTSNVTYIACAIRYALLENKPAKVVMDKEIFEKFTKLFCQIAENFGLNAQWWVADVQCLQFEQKH